MQKPISSQIYENPCNCSSKLVILASDTSLEALLTALIHFFADDCVLKIFPVLIFVPMNMPVKRMKLAP